LISSAVPPASPANPRTRFEVPPAELASSAGGVETALTAAANPVTSSANPLTALANPVAAFANPVAALSVELAGLPAAVDGTHTPPAGFANRVDGLEIHLSGSLLPKASRPVRATGTGLMSPDEAV